MRRLSILLAALWLSAAPALAATLPNYGGTQAAPVVTIDQNGGVVGSAVSLATTINPGTPVAPSRKVIINATAADSITLKLSSGDTFLLDVPVATTQLDNFAVVAASRHRHHPAIQ